MALKNVHHIMVNDGSDRPSAQDAFDKLGGNKYENILIMAQRARQIQARRNFQQKNSPQTKIKHDHHAITEVLQEVLDGKLTRDGVKHG